MPAKANFQIITGFTFGVIFLIAIIVLAIFFPEPTEFQNQVFRSVLALAAAGVAAMIPGTLGVEIPRFVRAGGAIAVFVLIYSSNPAQLVVSSPRKETGSNYEILETLFLIDLTERVSTGTNAWKPRFPRLSLTEETKFGN